MKLGLMQPYFFPYIGYFQLIKAVDEFILFDDVQYIRHGWVNRNRVLKANGGWRYIILPLKKHAYTTLIRNVRVVEDLELAGYLIKELEDYKNQAPFYSDTIELIRTILPSIVGRSIAHINEAIIKGIIQFLGIRTTLSVSSRKGFDYSKVHGPGDWALEIARQRRADEYINPIGGKELFDQAKFTSSGIRLSFLKPRDIIYSQGRLPFEPWLSIIDVLMFNGREGTMRLLDFYDIAVQNKST